MMPCCLACERVVVSGPVAAGGDALFLPHPEHASKVKSVPRVMSFLTESITGNLT